MQRFLLFLIRFYQLSFSYFLGRECRFVPSCSEYMREAIEVYGWRRGFSLGLKRIMRCHPWGGSGYDPP